MTVSTIDEFTSEFSDPRRCVLIPVSKLIVDRIVQRGLRSDKIERLANEWDWNVAEVITVVDLGNGKFRVTEGQHRAEAIRIRNPLASVWCVVVLDDEPTNPVREAEIAYDIQSTHKPHSAYDRWDLNVKRGLQHELEAEAVIAQHGLRLGTSPSISTIIAVAAVSGIIRDRKRSPEVGAELLDNTLWTVTHAWPEHDQTSGQSRFNANLLKAIAEIYARNEYVHRDRLVTALRSKMAARWIEDVQSTHGPKIEAIANGIIGVYNKHKKNQTRLGWGPE
jgi:hypothetical protein